MRGFEGFSFAVLLPALFASVLAFVIGHDIREAWRKRHRWAEAPLPSDFSAIKEVFKLAALSLWIILMLFVVYREMSFHYDLRSLQPKNIVEISVGEHHFTDQFSITQIVDALKSSEWYSSNHGGWGDETPIVLRTTSGNVWQMMVGYHFAQHGAVVIKSSQSNGRGWNLGEAFSPALPEVLEQLATPLSNCDIAHGHPCQISPTSAR
jgi:hypothetical protein